MEKTEKQPRVKPVEVREKEAFYLNTSNYTEKQKTFQVILEMSDGTQKIVADHLYSRDAYLKTYNINKNLGLNRASRVYKI